MKKDWTYKKLGEVAEIKAGFTPSSSELHEAGEYPYYKVSDMNTTGNEVFLISTLSYVKQTKKYFPKGSIAFPKNGAAIATNKKRILKYDSIVDLNTGVCIFDSDILPKFGYYWFQNIDFRNYTRGGALPTLDIKTISLKNIPIPPLSIQRSIVAELDLLHSVVSKKKEQLRELDNLTQSLFYQMFGDPITNPMGWEVKKLGEVAETYRGLTYSKKDETNVSSKKVLRSNNIDLLTHSLDLEDIKYLRDDFIIPEDKKIKKDSIFICMSNGSMQHLGKVAYIDKDYDYAFGGFMGLIVPRKSVSARFVYYNLLLPAFLQTVLKEGRGANINNLRFSDIENFSIILPPLSLQQSFAAKVSAIEAQKQAITQSIQHTEALLAQRMDNYFGI
jgi:type I restriction enzyme S subunit